RSSAASTPASSARRRNTICLATDASHRERFRDASVETVPADHGVRLSSAPRADSSTRNLNGYRTSTTPPPFGGGNSIFAITLSIQDSTFRLPSPLAVTALTRPLAPIVKVTVAPPSRPLFFTSSRS